MTQNKNPILSFENLRVRFDTPDGVVNAVNGLSIDVSPGEILGIVGESGSGKSQSWMAPLGLLADNANVEGHIWFDGQDLATASVKALNKIRGRRIAMIFQDPMTSLNPYLKVGTQLVEALRIHNKSLGRAEAKAKCIDMLEQVAIPDAPTRFSQYPHELSGGMRQRVMIAMALLNEPDVLIADEPTTALDVTIQAEILDILRALQQRLKMAVVFITHDLGVIATLCDRVAVMYAGQVVELGRVDQVLDAPRHPYTISLLRATPRFNWVDEGARVEAEDDAAENADNNTGHQSSPARLFSISGLPPNLKNLSPGCAFEARCLCAEPRCKTEFPDVVEAVETAETAETAQLIDTASPHQFRCWRREDSKTLTQMLEDATQ